MKGTVDIHVDLENFAPELDYPFEELLKDEVTDMVKEEVRKMVGARARREFRKWIKEEFLSSGELQIREGVVTVPLLLEGKELFRD